MNKLFSVIEYHTHFRVRHNPSGCEIAMGDGVDTLSDAEGESLKPGTDGFVEAWEDALNENADETWEAYFENQGAYSIDLCFSGWLRGCSIQNVYVDGVSQPIPISTTTAELVEKLKSGEWAISLAEALDEDSSDRDVEIFDFEVNK